MHYTQQQSLLCNGEPDIKTLSPFSLAFLYVPKKKDGSDRIRLSFTKTLVVCCFHSPCTLHHLAFAFPPIGPPHASFCGCFSPRKTERHFITQRSCFMFRWQLLYVYDLCAGVVFLLDFIRLQRLLHHTYGFKA